MLGRMSGNNDAIDITIHLRRIVRDADGPFRGEFRNLRRCAGGRGSEGHVF